jgi:hypothetical protein
MSTANHNVQNRSFLGAIAAAVKAFCVVLIDLCRVGEQAVGMAHKAVLVARKKQAIDLAIDMSHYATTTIDRASVEQSKQREAVRAYLEADPTGTRAAEISVVRETLSRLVQEELAQLESDGK